METQDPDFGAVTDGKPRADQLKEWIDVLKQRRIEWLRRRNETGNDPAAVRRIDRIIKGLDESLDALRVEAAVTEFFEDTVRAAIARPETNNLTGDDWEPKGAA